jgi:4-oxalocrotonate tautomerase
MPVILFYGPVTTMDKEKKKELVKSFTDSAAKITGIPASEFTVLLRATAPDLVGIGGELLCDLHEKR